MASRADRLVPALDLRKAQTETQLKVMAERQKKLSEGEGHLADLKRYRDGYEDPKEATTIESLLNRRQFVESIASVINRQQNEVSRLQRQYEFARNQWLEALKHEQALETVIERMREDERRKQDRLEQAETDERTLGRHLAKQRSEAHAA